MKKINLLIAAGLMASASMQAQVVASLGFEDSDPKERTSKWALNHQAGSFGDWVNKTDNDVWTEQVAGDVKEGEYAFQAVNDGTSTLESWMRAFKFVLADGAIKENTAYRVSFWVKAPEGGHITSWLSQGTENYDKSFCTADNQNFGIADMTLAGGDWKHVSFNSFYQAADTLNNVIAGQDWVGNAVFPEEFGGDGEKMYRDFFDHKLPNEYFFMVAMRTGGTYLLDDIKIEEGVTYNKVLFGATATSGENVVKFDFGFPTNIAALAGASETGSLSLDPSCVTVTVNGAPATVKFVEGKADGFLYAFLDLGEDVALEETDVVEASFTPAADCPIIYSSSLRPSSDRFSEMKVLAIAGAGAEFAVSDDLDVSSIEAGPGKMVSSIPENESFEIDSETFNQISVTYDKELDPDLEYASAVLKWNNDTREKDLSANMSLSDDGKTINIALTDKLADGEYNLYLYDVETKFWASCPDAKITFAVGPDNDQTISKTVFNTDSTFAATAQGAFPVGWVANDNGTIHQYGINEQGTVYNYEWGQQATNPIHDQGGSRGYTGFSGDIKGTAIYWRNFNGSRTNGTLTFGELVKDYKLVDGTIDPDMDPANGLYLDEGKYQITILMCAWKNLDGNIPPVYDFTLEDLDGNVYARFENVDAVPNMNGARGAVNNATKSQTDFNVSTPGYYVLKFSAQAGSELLLGSVNIITMPSKAAYWKQQLASAAASAKNVLDSAEDAIYDGDTKTALSNAYNSATTGHFTSPSEIQALIDEMAAESAKLQTRMTNIDKFVDAVASITEVPEDLTGKYTESDLYKSAIGTIETYKDVDPSTLSDDELAAAAPTLATATQQIGNVKSVVDALTWGLYKATQTYGIIATDDESSLNAALAAVTDDREVADAINAANKARVLEILADELEGGQIPADYLTVVNDTISGIELTGYVQNPKLYCEYNVSGIPGWTLEAGSDSTNLNIGYEGEDPSAAKPVTDRAISVYGNADYNMYQVLKNLPAGVYTVKFNTRTPLVDKTTDFGKIFYYNAQDSVTGEWDKYIYAGEGDAQGVAPYYGGNWSNSDENFTFVENLEVGEDGTLLIGAREHYVSGKAERHEDNTPQSFWTGTSKCDDIRIFLVAPLEGYDYATAAKEAATGIEATEVAQKSVKSNVKYNFAGQRVDDSYNGFVIINGKKYKQGK